MGYSHYWQITKVITANEWQAFIADVKVLLTRLPKDVDGDVLALSGCRLYEKPNITMSHIWLNGSDGSPRTWNQREGLWNDTGKHDLNHETFAFRRTLEWTSCKTDRKPYDLVVCAILILAKIHFPNAITIKSGGNWDDPTEWVPAKQLVATVFPEKMTQALLEITSWLYPD